MRKIKSRELRDNLAATLADVENGETVIVEQYNRPVARLVPYKETVMYTIEIQATSDGEIWQTVDSAETITEAEAAEMDYTDAADVARETARHQNLVDGEGWRVRVWTGEDPDTGGEPDGECYAPSAITADHLRELATAEFSDLAVLAIDTDGDAWICPQSTAHEHHAHIVTDADALESYTGGVQDEHTDSLYAAFADELNSEREQHQG